MPNMTRSAPAGMSGNPGGRRASRPGAWRGGRGLRAPCAGRRTPYAGGWAGLVCSWGVASDLRRGAGIIPPGLTWLSHAEVRVRLAPGHPAAPSGQRRRLPPGPWWCRAPGGVGLGSCVGGAVLGPVFGPRARLPRHGVASGFGRGVGSAVGRGVGSRPGRGAVSRFGRGARGWGRGSGCGAASRTAPWAGLLLAHEAAPCPGRGARPASEARCWVPRRAPGAAPLTGAMVSRPAPGATGPLPPLALVGSSRRPAPGVVRGRPGTSARGGRRP